jgi:PAS domain S-box-containing protein
MSRKRALHKAREPAGTGGHGIPAPAFFPVVGIGGSAGGLDAFTRLLQGLATDTGMAFVFVQHLAAQHASLLTSLLSQATAMPVGEVQDGVALKPNHIYVIPPNTLMSVVDGRLNLEPRSRERGAARPIDHFFRSLAFDRKTLAIGVLLSGSDSDGAMGLQAIRAEGGIAIVQTEDSAKFPDMPRNAVAAGAIDLVLSPEEIAIALGSTLREAMGSVKSTVAATGDANADEFRAGRILELLRTATGADFRGYKRATVLRRIARRMMLRRHTSWEAYASDLSSDPSELLALHEDILIGVTEFFRDPETFVALQNNILRRLVRERPPDAALRVWVPGCSTGQEAYSVAICVMEVAAEQPAHVPVQIFGTDLSDRAITIARAGVFPECQISTLSPERQSRFFVQTDQGYRIIKPVREMCVFARQNLLADPPFAHLDLISCRNVLIYLEPSLQRRAVSTFHFALRPEGYLVVGHSEGMGELSELFSVIDQQHKFYKKRNGHIAATAEWSPTRLVESTRPVPVPLTGSARSSDLELQKAAERVVLSEYGPAWVVLNERLEIIHSGGDTTAYLQLPPGRATFALLKMVRNSVRSELRKLLAKAASDGASTQSTVVDEKRNGEIGRIQLAVRRLDDRKTHATGFLVLFLATADSSGSRADTGSNCPEPNPVEVERLTQELALTRQRLEAIINEREVVNQDLTTANEEIQSSNEELQSINEELETSKEELQSANEELNTMNEELRRAELAASASREFAESVVESLRTPVVVLRSDLRVRTANRAFCEAYGLQHTEIQNQPFHRIGDGQWNLPELRSAFERLSADHTPIENLELEQEFINAGKRTVSINARPIAADGEHQILVAVDDITAHRRAEEILLHQQRRLQHSIEVGAAELERTAKTLHSESMSRSRAESVLHETEAALIHSREELRALAASLLHTQDEERRRVSRELHDDLSQRIAKLQFDVEMLEQQLPSKLRKFKDRLLALRDEVGGLSNDVRRIAYQLHPSTLDHLGLSVAFRSFTRDFAEREGLDIEFTARKVPKRISPAVASSLYRVLQEALRNVAKHAGKTAVTVALTGGSKDLCLTVQDHGTGFDAAAVRDKGGLGLISMQERVRLVRGEFSLKAQPGRGVVLTVRVPLS